MKTHELMRNEQDFVAALSDKERAIYLVDDATEAKLVALNDSHVNDFLGIARVLNELNTLHEQYNELYDAYCVEAEVPAASADIEKLLDTQLRMTIAVGTQATVLDLSIMDNCDIVYGMLADLKMLAFDNIYNYSAAATKLETL